MKSLAVLLTETPYVSYTYSYPHKMAHRYFDTPVLLSDLWKQENRDALFLYMHIPFCEMRCGFCNLFTTANPDEDLEKTYLHAVQRQAERVNTALGTAGFARMALGGGTPTYLSLGGLGRLFDLADDLFGVQPGSIPMSVETSPFTAQPDKLALLRERGIKAKSSKFLSPQQAAMYYGISPCGTDFASQSRGEPRGMYPPRSQPDQHRRAKFQRR